MLTARHEELHAQVRGCHRVRNGMSWMEAGMKQVADDKRNLNDSTISTESSSVAAQVPRVAGGGVWPALSQHVEQTFKL